MLALFFGHTFISIYGIFTAVSSQYNNSGRFTHNPNEAVAIWTHLQDAKQTF